jgi:isocitrate dehydrogenase
MMLNHMGFQDSAQIIKNAWSRTVEEGIHTRDIFKEGLSKRLVSTPDFTEAVIANLGKKPEKLKSVEYARDVKFTMPVYKRKKPAKKTLRGVDVFVDWRGTDADKLAQKLKSLEGDMKLTMITNRGVKVWPGGFSETFRTDHWRCRFEAPEGKSVKMDKIPVLLAEAVGKDIDIIKTENLYEFDGVQGYSLGQGQ